MATVINNPGSTTDSSSGGSFLLAVIILAVVVLLFIVYGLPAIRNSGSGIGTGGGTNQPPQINVPKDVNINLRETK